MCGNPNYYKSFEESIADEKERLRLRNEDELIDLTPEEEEAYFAAWVEKQREWLDKLPPPIIPWEPSNGGMPEEEYEARLNEAIANFDWEKACDISGLELSRGSISYFKKIGIINGLFDKK